jgi:hypothetical protein
MGDNGDLKAAIDALTKNVAAMQSSIQANAKAIEPPQALAPGDAALRWQD